MYRIQELYDSRYILKSLVVKSLKGKYSNSVFGLLWHFFTPLLILIVYYIAFSGFYSNSLPNFWLYLASGLFSFSYMMSCLNGGAGIITSSGGMIKKMYFPRELIVLAHSIVNFIVMIIGYLVVLVAMVLFDVSLNISLFMLPLAMLLLFLFSTGAAFLLSSLTVYIRDIQYLMGATSMVFFFLTPMYFVIDNVVAPLSYIVWINPMTYFVELFHEILYYSSLPSFGVIVPCVLISIVSFLVGLSVFNVLKGGFAERL